MPTSCSVYGLLTEGEAIRYVGQTVVPLDLRLKRHIADARCRQKSRVRNWIKSRLAETRAIKIVLLSENARWNTDEIAWIAKLRADGCDLLNMTGGGDGFRDIPPEVRKKIADARRGKPVSIRTMQVAGDLMRERWRTPEWRMRMDAVLRRKQNEEHTRRAVAGRKAASGYGHSETTKVKMSASQRKRFESAEARVAISAATRAAMAHPSVMMKISGENGSKAKLTALKIAELRREWATGLCKQRELAVRFGISQSAVSRIVTADTWRAA